MSLTILNRLHKRAGPPALGPAIIAGLGCALPLMLGLSTGHSGFWWVTLGALLSAQATPLHRFGMLRMLTITITGAISAGLGFWAASDALISSVVFTAYGLLLAWLHRYGTEASKIGFSLAICLCLGQGHFGAGNLHNPNAVAILFAIGGCWVMLLAFALRAIHGLRMWPYMPRFISILRVLQRHAQRLPARQWRLHALACALAVGSSGVVVASAGLSHGYWLTIAVIATLQLEFSSSLARSLLISLGSLSVAATLLLIGYSVQNPASLVMLTLPLVILSRALHAKRYGVFVLQLSVCAMLLTECLATDWQTPLPRMLNSLIGMVLVMAIALLMNTLYRQGLKFRRAAKRRQPITQPADTQTEG